MINKEKFISWIENRFDSVKYHKNEIKINSIFCDDNKNHLWCNVCGGKNHRKWGVYRCWKTDNKGSLISLVMKVDNCDFKTALKTLSDYEYNIDNFDEDIKKFIKDDVNYWEEYYENISKIQLPPNTFDITTLKESSIKSNCIKYLKSRKMPIHLFKLCIQESEIEHWGKKYLNRLIIPYYDKLGDLIYFNSRLLYDSKYYPKYLGPPMDIVNVGKSDVVYFPFYPKKGTEIFLTEGEIDAITLCLCGLPAAAIGGKNIDEKQLIPFIKNEYKINLAFDNDQAGTSAIINCCNLITKYGFFPKLIIPIKEYKDWNKMYEIGGKEFVTKNIKIFDFNYIESNILQCNF